MKTAQVFLIVWTVALFLEAVLALKCATCSSDISAADCRKNTQILDCRSVLNRCETVFTKTTRSVTWRKGCTAGSNCDPARSCPIEHKGCTVDCCDSDVCNGNQKIKGCIGVILIGTLVALLLH